MGNRAGGWTSRHTALGRGSGPDRGWAGRWPDPHGRGWPEGRRRVGLAVLVAIIQVVGARAADVVPVRALDLAAYALLVAGPVALVWRRRFPAAVFAVTLVPTVAYALAGYPRGPFVAASVVALFAAVKAGRRTAAWLLTAVAYLLYLVLTRALDVPEPVRPSLREAVVLAAWLVGALALAEANRVRAQHLGQLARYRAEQARAREEQQRRQASEERLRIARELHDVLGHHLSLINVQAGVGLHLMDGRPEQAREALTAIKAASAEALREVRAVLGVLRPEEESAPRAPAPGLDRLAELAADAGLPVRVRIRGSAHPLPAEVDRAAYRIVQEALTNVRRHAGPDASAVVTIGYDDGAVTIRVEDDGTLTPSDGDGEGSGIAGMRARAAALGGRLTAGPRPEGGFRVEARLPVDAADFAGPRRRDDEEAPAA